MLNSKRLCLALCLSAAATGGGCASLRTTHTPHYPPSNALEQSPQKMMPAHTHAPGIDDHAAVRPAVGLGIPVPLAIDDPEPATTIVDNREISWANDRAVWLSEFEQDTKSLLTLHNAAMLFGAGAISYATHETLDDQVADHTARHPRQLGDFADVLGGIGNPAHHFPAIAALYGYSLWQDDAMAHELSLTLLNAAAITQATTVVLKVAANSTRPNGDPHGWPSGHTSSSFAVASVLHEYYGPRVGLAAFTLAGLVAWERIDDREHDLSDVMFGAALGYVVGTSVARAHQDRFFSVIPYVDPMAQNSGVLIEHRY